ncbi:hypothetical protein Patl1_32462 [Pistacia atlantica]|uniref:Uncharacterized protein n=1 Tax=Pistacia atlantica TaxID=434234 RepID=A0ACC1ALZ8_9ROSI|nr:hypothetical protein Patl1_32462 [Pistacia atlantica]
MAAALVGEDLTRTMSRCSMMQLGSRWKWMASASLASTSIREAWNSQTNVFAQSQRQDDEKVLRWAAIERLPTYDQLRKEMLRQVLENGKIVHDEVDVTTFATENEWFRVSKTIRCGQQSLLRDLGVNNKIGLNFTKPTSIRYGQFIPIFNPFSLLMMSYSCFHEPKQVKPTSYLIKTAATSITLKIMRHQVLLHF